MLEEVIGVFLSLFSLFLNETPRVAFQEDIQETCDAEVENQTVREDHDKWLPYINKEYDSHEELGSVPSSHSLNELLPVNYSTVGYVLHRRTSYWTSVWKSFSTSLSITLAIFPPTALIIFFVYLDLNTNDLCMEWEFHNHSLPFSQKRFRVIGHSVELIITNLWFPLTAVILFGWKEFKQLFLSTFYIAFIFGEATVIFYMILFIFGAYGAHTYYRFLANLLFFVALISCCVVVVWKIRLKYRGLRYSKSHLMALVSAEFVVCTILSFVYSYGIVPFFNSLKREDYKFLVAAMAPGLTIIPAAICKHLALRRSSEVIEPGRSFVLVYYVRSGVIYLYRVMQADFKNIWLFIGLSFFSNVLNFLVKATHEIRMKLWRKIISLLRQTVCCRHLYELPSNTPHYRRLKADLEIQAMLFDYGALVASQAYYVLYFVESYQIPMLTFFYESLIRVAIGIGIDFLFNFLSNFVEIHYYDIPIGRVWSKYWKRHMFANFIVVMVTVSYFTGILFTVFQAREAGTGDEQYIVKNCTLF